MFNLAQAFELELIGLEKTRLRIRFTKCGDLRWISHRDLARVWERLLRRANLELAFSQGFHPKPRISFPSALALGIESLEEVVELEVVGDVSLQRVEQDICNEMPAGMRLLQLESPSYGLGKARVAGMTYRIAIAQELRAELEAAILAAKHSDQLEVIRDDKKIACSTADPNFDVHLDSEFFHFSIPNVAQGSIRPSELLDYFGLGQLLADGVTLQRTEVHLHEPELVQETSG